MSWADWWPRCRDWLTPAMVDTTEAEVVQLLASDHAQLWPGDGAAMVVQLLAGPPKGAHIWLAGGDMTGLLAMRPGLEAWARWQGCREISLNGRRGWQRVLAEHGYAPQGENLIKGLGQ